MSTYSNVEQFKIQYPGFPDFVHYLMENIRCGKTVEESVEDVRGDEIKIAIARSIDQIQKTRATYAIDGTVVLPDDLD